MKRLRISVLATVLLAGSASASMVVPVDVQMDLFANIAKLDRNADPAKGVTLAIVYQRGYPESVSTKESVLAAVRKQNPRMVCVLLEADNPEILRRMLANTEANVLYIAPLRAVEVSEIAQISRSRGIRTITGVPEYVKAGIAVGIGLQKQRPLIIINLEAARAEGAAFSSQLLSLARIVGPLH
jgi:hypothetical protein